MNLTEFDQADRCVHFSCPERSVSPSVYIFLYVCSAVVVLLTLCGNLLIIISIFHFKLLHTPTNILVLSLAMSDFLVGALVMPAVSSWRIESCWIFGRCFCIVFWLVGSFIILISVYSIALIAVDRYLALSDPFFYVNTISVRTMCIVVYFNWCVCLGYATTLSNINLSLMSSIMCPGECFFFLSEVWTIIDLVVSFIFPLSVIIILYTLVFVIAKKHASAIRKLKNHRQSKTQRITSHSMKSERKAAKVLGILVSVFLMCLFPYFIYSLLGDVVELDGKTFLYLQILACLNSTMNPVIYALFYPWFRRCVKIITSLQIFQTDSSLINVLL